MNTRNVGQKPLELKNKNGSVVAVDTGQIADDDAVGIGFSVANIGHPVGQDELKNASTALATSQLAPARLRNSKLVQMWEQIGHVRRVL